MTLEIVIKAKRVPQNITTFRRPSQSENHPKKGAPTANPMKINETACAEMFWEIENASEI